MATSIVIEEESGTGSGLSQEHNGYYAGDFSTGSRPALSTGVDSRWIAYNVRMLPAPALPR
ncbi:MAG TPA: hypothetical protein VLK34_04655 [Nocardioidaceae bacterium]|nr:hypothetical protein [Nocardioidaceae bacterium]